IMKKLTIILIALILSACDQEFLDVKPNASLLVPEKAWELQALLDKYTIINGDGFISQIASDDQYTSSSVLQSAAAAERNAYLWEEFDDNGNFDWNYAYANVFTANIVLEGLDKLQDLPTEEMNTIRGHALFLRGISFFNLAQVFCDAYDDANAENLLGLPLKLNSDIHEKYTRASLKDTYQQIISDILEASELLPLKGMLCTRPSKPAALTLLA